jgi:acyl-CoA synthetase (AMP-forming)/AMP-acid ligase II
MTQASTKKPEEERAAAMSSGMVLAFHAGVAPDRPAFISDAGSRTFGELNANANRLARALRARGITAGDALVLVCSNRPEFAEVLNATNRIGVRATPANWHLTGDELAYIVDNCEAKAIVGDAQFADAVRARRINVRPQRRRSASADRSMASSPTKTSFLTKRPTTSTIRYWAGRCCTRRARPAVPKASTGRRSASGATHRWQPH